MKGTGKLSQTEQLAPDPKTPPRRRIGALVLVRDPLGRVLLVEPHYKGGWMLPGGGVRKDEPAVEAALRHLEIETGLKVSITYYVAVDQVPFNPANEYSEAITRSSTAESSRGGKPKWRLVTMARAAASRRATGFIRTSFANTASPNRPAGFAML